MIYLLISFNSYSQTNIDKVKDEFMIYAKKDYGSGMMERIRKLKITPYDTVTAAKIKKMIYKDIKKNETSDELKISLMHKIDIIGGKIEKLSESEILSIGKDINKLTEIMEEVSVFQKESEPNIQRCIELIKICLDDTDFIPSIYLYKISHQFGEAINAVKMTFYAAAIGDRINIYNDPSINFYQFSEESQSLFKLYGILGILIEEKSSLFNNLNKATQKVESTLKALKDN